MQFMGIIQNTFDRVKHNFQPIFNFGMLEWDNTIKLNFKIKSEIDKWK